MSFSFNFIAGNKAAARAKLAKEYAPDSVKAFVGAAIDGLVNVDDRTAIVVKGAGHLCDSPSSYQTSTATIEVYPLTVTVPAIEPEALPSAAE